MTGLPERSRSSRRVLLIAVAIGFFIATFLAGYWIMGVVLYFNIFGDNSPNFGKYAVAISLPLTAFITVKFWHYCVSRNVSQKFLGISLLLTCFLAGLLSWPMAERILGRLFDAIIRVIAVFIG